MKTVQASDHEWLEITLAHLRNGGVAALPTDTVYGLAASIARPSGVRSIYLMKKRPGEKALPLQTAGVEEAAAWGFHFSRGALALAEAFWPGALTLILPRPAACPAWFAPRSGTLALRVPGHPVPLAVLRALSEPMAVTSANPSGAPDAKTAVDVEAFFRESEELLVVNGGGTPGVAPSTVVDATGPEPKITRKGPLSFETIREAWDGR